MLTDVALWAIPSTSSAAFYASRSKSPKLTQPRSYTISYILVIVYQGTDGVLTISAPRARSITSFSRLIFAGKVMIHEYPLRAHAIASPIPVENSVGSIRAVSEAADLCYRLPCQLMRLERGGMASSLVGSITTLFPGTNVPSFSAS
jgi:hypothetical protein